MSPPTASFAEQFAAWEHRGRGWTLAPYLVELEPPFTPFFYSLPNPAPGTDDGRTETWGSRLVARVSGQHATYPAAADEIAEPDGDPPAPEPFDEPHRLVRLPVAPPPGWKAERDATRQFLVSVSHAVYPIAFELVGDGSCIEAQFVAAGDDEALVRAAIRAQFPEVATTNGAVRPEPAPFANARHGTVVVDFGLAHECTIPFGCATSFDPDPLLPAIAALEEVEENEVGMLQVLFQAVRRPWTASILRAVVDPLGKPFFPDAPQLATQAKAKCAQPLFAAVVRVAGASPDPARAWELARRIAGCVAGCADPLGNELIPLTNDGYPDPDHAADLMCRRSRRTGMLLNADEVLSFVHIPSASVTSSKLVRAVNRTRRAPDGVPCAGLVLGENMHHGHHRPVALDPEMRSRHVYVIGASGTGKSTLLSRCIVQDLESGNGCAVIDPHGDLVDDILARIPPKRVRDVIFIDPASDERSPGFNILRAHSPLEKVLLASDLVALFRRFADSWGDQMNAVLANAVTAFLEHPEGGTLADLRRFLVDDGYRANFLCGVRDPDVLEFWEKTFPMLGGKPQAPILTRLDAFLRPKPLRRIVASSRNGIDVRRVMDEGNVLLVKLPMGAIGEENAALLGSLIVTKFHQASLTREELAPQDRTPFTLYLDEFHRFLTPSLAAMLAGARKYRMGLVLAHQELRQLAARDADVAGAAMANAATRIAFRVGDADAKRLAPSFASFEASDLMNLPVGRAVARIGRSDWDFSLEIAPLPALTVEEAERQRSAAVAAIRWKARAVEEPEPPRAAEAAPPDPAGEFARFLDRHLPPAAQSRHIYIAGKSQYGKSSLLYTLAVRDMERGEGLAVIDPHGDLVERLLHAVPEHRVADAIYLDATAPIPLDFMGWATERERDTLADDLLVTFKRFSTTWGERMESIIRYTIYTLLAAKGATFLDLYTFLAHEERRREILRGVTDPVLRDFWRDEFPHLPRDAATPITSRMSKFLLTPSLRSILGDPHPKLSVPDMMEGRKILLVNLAKIGEESGHLLGTLLVSKIEQAAMRRQAQPPAARIPFHLYVDEFQHFQTGAFDAILSEAGKYRLCLTMANQYIDQLDPQIRSSILGNVSTFFLFRLHERDAAHFAGEIKPKKADDLTGLPPGTALVRTAGGEATFVTMPMPQTHEAAGFAEAIKSSTIARYAATISEELVSSDDGGTHPTGTGRPKHLPPHARQT